jgi:hypothetical protein
MGYERWNQNTSFVDIALSRSLEKNRSMKTMERIDRVIDWSKVENVCWTITGQEDRRKAPMPIPH